MALPPIPRLAPESMQLGADPKLLRDELAYLIMLHAASAPRTLQTTIGPSELGTPCDRKLGFLVAETPAATGHTSGGSWRSSVGTAVHAYLAEIFALRNQDQHEQLGFSRFLIETRVSVGEIDGYDVLGTSDLYDRATATVIDWKVVGPTTIRAAKANGPGRKYRVQLHTYGRGFTRRGLPVERVAIFYLPSAGDIRDAYMWSEDYDESFAAAAIQRANATAVGMRLAGTDFVRQLDTEDDYCTSCRWFDPRLSEASSEGCPGHGRKAPAVLPDGNDILGAA